MSGWKDAFKPPAVEPVYRLTEIFRSVQFEGYWSGTVAWFIRFAGCNLNCPWCDTPKGKIFEVPLTQLLALEDFRNQTVILTGGEPTLQELLPLVDALRAQGARIRLETNGILPQQMEKLRSMGIWITWSPKSIEHWNITYGHYLVQDLVDEIKVICGTLQPEQLVFCSEVANKWYCRKYMQPCETNGEFNFKQAFEFCVKHPEWRISFQVQKLLGIK